MTETRKIAYEDDEIIVYYDPITGERQPYEKKELPEEEEEDEDEMEEEMEVPINRTGIPVFQDAGGRWHRVDNGRFVKEREVVFVPVEDLRPKWREYLGV